MLLDMKLFQLFGVGFYPHQALIDLKMLKFA